MKTYSQFTRKNVGSFLFGPLAIVPTIFILLSFEAFFNQQASSTMWIGVFPLYAGLGFLIAYIATLLLGVPSVIVLSKYGRLTLINLLLVGLLPITVATLIISPTIFSWFGLIKWLFEVSIYSTGNWILSAGSKSRENLAKKPSAKPLSTKEIAFDCLCYFIGTIFWVIVIVLCVYVFS